MLDTLNGLLSRFGRALADVLPQSPFSDFFSGWEAGYDGFGTYIGYLNWFFPVRACVSLFEAWLVAVLAYMVYSVIMRWVKVID